MLGKCTNFHENILILKLFEHINSTQMNNIYWLDVEKQELEPLQDVDGAVLRNVLANQSNLIGRK